jgi:hypothetical protein
MTKCFFKHEKMFLKPYDKMFLNTYEKMFLKQIHSVQSTRRKSFVSKSGMVLLSFYTYLKLFLAGLDLKTKGLIMWSLVLVSKLVTTT